MRYLPIVLLLGCGQIATAPSNDAPSVVPSAATFDPEAIQPVSESSSWRITAIPMQAQPLTNEEWIAAHSVPHFQIETVRSCPTCYGFGGTVVALAPSRKAAEDHAVALRSLIAVYKGSEWNRHLTTVPWFGEGKYALVFANTFTEPSEQMCAWLRARGWGYGSGLAGSRECKVYSKWPPDKP